MANVPKGTPRDIFDPHHAEIQRRRAAADACEPLKKRSTFGPSPHAMTEGVSSTYEVADQRVLLVSVSHRGIPPLSLDGHGAVRLYGAFESLAELQDHAPAVMQADPVVSLLSFPMREWFVVPSTLERARDAEAMNAKREQLLALHRRVSEEDRRDFEDHHGKRGEERDDLVDDHSRRIEDLEDEDDEDGEADRGAAAAPAPPAGKQGYHKRVTAAMQVAGQRYAAISFVCPTEDPDGEFLVMVHACFDTTAEADAWVRGAAAPRVQDHHIDVVKMYEWVRPHLMSSKAAPGEVFRDSELDAIMQHHRSEPSRVQQYRDWMRDNPTPGTLTTDPGAPVSASEALADDDMGAHEPLSK